MTRTHGTNTITVPATPTAYPHPTSRSQSWVRLLMSPRHGELLRPGIDSPRSIFFTGMVLRANHEPC